MFVLWAAKQACISKLLKGHQCPDDNQCKVQGLIKLCIPCIFQVDMMPFLKLKIHPKCLQSVTHVTAMLTLNQNLLPPDWWSHCLPFVWDPWSWGDCLSSIGGSSSPSNKTEITNIHEVSDWMIIMIKIDKYENNRTHHIRLWNGSHRPNEHVHSHCCYLACIFQNILF